MKEEIKEQARQVAAKFGKTYDQRLDIEGRCLEAAWQVEDQIDTNKNPQAYLWKIMQNVAIDYLRKTSKIKEIPLNAAALSFSPEESLVSSILYNDLLSEILATLTFPDKDIIEYLIAGYTLVEIGKELSMKPNSITVRLHRKRKLWENKLRV